MSKFPKYNIFASDKKMVILTQGIPCNKRICAEFEVQNEKKEAAIFAVYGTVLYEGDLYKSFFELFLYAYSPIEW